MRVKPTLSHAVSKIGIELRRIVARATSGYGVDSKIDLARSAVPSCDPSSTMIQSNGTDAAAAVASI